MGALEADARLVPCSLANPALTGRRRSAQGTRAARRVAVLQVAALAGRAPRHAPRDLSVDRSRCSGAPSFRAPRASTSTYGVGARPLEGGARVNARVSRSAALGPPLPLTASRSCSRPRLAARPSRRVLALRDSGARNAAKRFLGSAAAGRPRSWGSALAFLVGRLRPGAPRSRWRTGAGRRSPATPHARRRAACARRR